MSDYIQYDINMYNKFMEGFVKEDASIDELRARMNLMVDILEDKESLFHVMTIICLEMLSIATSPDSSE